MFHACIINPGAEPACVEWNHVLRFDQSRKWKIESDIPLYFRLSSSQIKRLPSLSFRVVLLPSSSREKNSTFPPSVWSRITFSSDSGVQRNGEHARSHILTENLEDAGSVSRILSAPRMTRLILSSTNPRKSWGVAKAGGSESEHTAGSVSFDFYFVRISRPAGWRTGELQTGLDQSGHIGNFEMWLVKRMLSSRTGHCFCFHSARWVLGIMWNPVWILCLQFQFKC